MNLKTIKKIHQICIRKGNYEKENEMEGACKCLCSSSSCDIYAVYGNAGPCRTSGCNAANR